MTEHYDVVIIGAGAAGMMCAIEAGKRGRKVLLLESQEVVVVILQISILIQINLSLQTPAI